MNAKIPNTVFLENYTAPDFSVSKTELKFTLHEDYTLVESRLVLQRNGSHERPLVLNGNELELTAIKLNGQALAQTQYHVDEEFLTVEQVPDSFELEVTTRIFPQSNTSLEGLYKSRTMFCTQCEAEGFRKITYFPDRPDVLSIFTVTVEADKQRYPVLLANGNCIDSGELEGGRHFAVWHDPYLKPCYLFALVAGELGCVEDTFTTAGGRQVELKIFVEEKDLGKCDHAMTSLKNAMRWDEEVYGREYDLDIYMIVAVDDFNMGAMENKGLNIFNTSCVLASPETTTDAGFQRVEGVIAHEYFHNWSGNRVTCRDWFQLSLKEGFTVFRDEEFSADMGSRTVKRVEGVQLLRSLQFAEDAGPMAHPVRPASYIEISNFYTLTVYEKGSEVVRMIHTLLGPDLFRKGSDLYFERHDGQAATIEDFVAAMADASGFDFTRFMHWYSQAGTPVLEVSDEYDAAQKTYRLTFRQSCPSTPEADASQKQPFVIPVAMGLVGEHGTLDLQLASEPESAGTHRVLVVDEPEQSFTFTGVDARPVPALLRNYSAPVKLNFSYSEQDLLRLIRSEDDGFCRWDACQSLAVRAITEELNGHTGDASTALASGFSSLLEGASADPAMVALMLALPSEEYLQQQFKVVDVEGIHAARERVRYTLAEHLQEPLWETYGVCKTALQAKTGMSADVIALRSLKNTALSYLMMLHELRYIEACWEQYLAGGVMSDVFSALAGLVYCPHTAAQTFKQKALETFYEKWQKEPLVVNQWFAVQAANPEPGTLERVKQLMSHPAFDVNNPNKIRSLIGVFCNQNHVQFHQRSGAGYEFLADQIIELNRKNPQIAARLVTPFTKWKRYDEPRQCMIKQQLARIAAHENLSRDVYEIVDKSLKP